MTLVAGALRRACAGRGCACLEFANASTAAVAAPAEPLVPSVVLEAPETAAACEGFEASALSSGGSGGRDFASVAWAVEDASGAAVFGDVRSGGDAGWFALALSADAADALLNGSAAATLFVSVALTNFLGGSANATAAITVARAPRRRTTLSAPTFDVEGRRRAGEGRKEGRAPLARATHWDARAGRRHAAVARARRAAGGRDRAVRGADGRRDRRGDGLRRPGGLRPGRRLRLGRLRRGLRRARRRGVGVARPAPVLARAARARAAKGREGGQLQTAPISVDFHSFWLIFGRVIISRNGLDRERLSLERARAERPR